MKRRDFVTKSSLAVMSLATFGSVLRGKDDIFVGDCDTTNDILGPFYKPDAPIREDLTFEGLQGNVITVKGKVFGDDCITPLENALVEIWHCDTKGEYDNDSPKRLHRARWFTNKEGEYSFRTILPGKYLNGGQYRPSHIHFRVTANGNKELVSQIYFQGDPHITKDPWASKKKAENRVLAVIPEGVHGDLAVNFDIFLGKK